MLGVRRQSQFGVTLGECAADETLGTHVGQEPGQAAMQRAGSLLLVHPATAALEGNDAAEWQGIARGIDLDDRHFGADALDMPRNHIHLGACGAHLEHFRAADQRCQGSRGSRLADTEVSLYLGAGDRTLCADERKHGGGVLGWCGERH